MPLRPACALAGWEPISSKPIFAKPNIFCVCACPERSDARPDAAEGRCARPHRPSAQGRQRATAKGMDALRTAPVRCLRAIARKFRAERTLLVLARRLRACAKLFRLLRSRRDHRNPGRPSSDQAVLSTTAFERISRFERTAFWPRIRFSSVSSFHWPVVSCMGRHPQGRPRLRLLLRSRIRHFCGTPPAHQFRLAGRKPRPLGSNRRASFQLHRETDGHHQGLFVLTCHTCRHSASLPRRQPFVFPL